MNSVCVDAWVSGNFHAPNANCHARGNLCAENDIKERFYRNQFNSKRSFGKNNNTIGLTVFRGLTEKRN